MVMMGRVGTEGVAQGTAGDLAGRLDALFRDEYAPMVRLAFTLIGNEAEAEELVQDSFVDVYRHLDGIRRPGAYLRSAVVSRCRSALRRRAVASAAGMSPPAEVSSSAGELWDVLARLSEEQRTAVVLRYYGGYRSAEIARLLEMPAATVRSHLRRGLAVMRKELEP